MSRKRQGKYIINTNLGRKGISPETKIAGRELGFISPHYALFS